MRGHREGSQFRADQHSYRFAPPVPAFATEPSYQPQIAIVARDRGDAYALAAAKALPEASQTATAKLNALDREDYLRQVLKRIAEDLVGQVHELLPWNLIGVQARPDQRHAA